MQTIAKEQGITQNMVRSGAADNTRESVIRVHRVGSITAGISLVAFGILFLLRLFTDLITYEMVFSLWPVVLIGLGAEILMSNIKTENLKYDKGAVALMMIMMIFASGMAIASEALSYAGTYNL